MHATTPTRDAHGEQLVTLDLALDRATRNSEEIGDTLNRVPLASVSLDSSEQRSKIG